MNIFSILILIMLAPLILHFFNHILLFFLKFLTSVYRITVNHFRIGGGQFHRSFIIRVDYIFYYTEFFDIDTFFNFSIFTIIDIYFLLLHSWIIFLTSGTLYGIFRMSSLFLHSRNRTLKSYYNKATRRKCVTLSNLELFLLCYFLFQLLNKIDIRKSRIENLKEVNTRESICLHSIKSMELVEKTELLRRLSVYALSKIHLDRCASFCKILLILSWYISLNPGTVHGIQNENLLHVLPFHDCIFSGDSFYYNLNSLSKNVSKNEWNVFRNRNALYSHKYK